MGLGRRDDDSGSSAAPFMIALGVVVLVLIAIGLISLFGREADMDQEQVIRATIGQNDALQRVDHDAYASYTCPEQTPDAAELTRRQHDSSTERGPRYVEDVVDVAVDGDKATAKAIYFFESNRDEKVDATIDYVRVDGQWKVCSATPS